MNPLAEYFSS